MPAHGYTFRIYVAEVIYRFDSRFRIGHQLFHKGVIRFFTIFTHNREGGIV
ncbi:hypothetical protein D9M68_951580 [compost metagenome]